MDNSLERQSSTYVSRRRSWVGAILSAYGSAGTFLVTSFNPPLYRYRDDESAFRADLEAVGNDLWSGWERRHDEQAASR